MATHTDFLKLNERLSQAREKLAVLKSQEAAKEAERNVILGELQEAGVDVTNLPGELARLEAEIAADYEKAEAAVTEFESKLAIAQTGTVATPYPPVGEDGPVKQAFAKGGLEVLDEVMNLGENRRDTSLIAVDSDVEID